MRDAPRSSSVGGTEVSLAEQRGRLCRTGNSGVNAQTHRAWGAEEKPVWGRWAKARLCAGWCFWAGCIDPTVFRGGVTLWAEELV